MMIELPIELDFMDIVESKCIYSLIYHGVLRIVTVFAKNCVDKFFELRFDLGLLGLLGDFGELTVHFVVMHADEVFGSGGETLFWGMCLTVLFDSLGNLIHLEILFGIPDDLLWESHHLRHLYTKTVLDLPLHHFVLQVQLVIGAPT